MNKVHKNPAVNAVNVEDSDEDTPFMYDNITFKWKKESAFQILQCSTILNKNEEDENAEEKEENRSRYILKIE